MRILGIDPGLATLGWGVIEAVGGRFYPVACGAVTTPAHTALDARLAIESETGKGTEVKVSFPLK